MAKIGRSSATAAFACIFVCMLLLLATQTKAAAAAAAAAAGMGSIVDEKRLCESQSHKFKGRCLSDHNCGSVCNTEGFPGGKCRGFRQRCFCTRPC